MSRRLRATGLVVVGIVSLLAGPTAARSEGQATLRGTVRDAEGKPVDGAVVMAAIDGSERPPKAVSSDAEGKFRIAGLSPDVYRVTVRKAGFLTREQSDVTVRGEASLDLQLEKPRPLAALGATSAESGAPAAGGGVARAGGRSISITGVPKEQAAKEEQTGVRLAAFADDLALMEFLNQLSHDGREVVDVIPLGVTESLFVTRPLGERPRPAYLVLPVYEPIEEGRVKDRLLLQKGRELLGIHRLSTDSYALVFK